MLSSFKDLLAATGTPANAGRGMLDALRERLLPSLKAGERRDFETLLFTRVLEGDGEGRLHRHEQEHEIR